jgi:hypothetical protein
MSALVYASSLFLPTPARLNQKRPAERYHQHAARKPRSSSDICLNKVIEYCARGYAPRACLRSS